AGQALQHRTRLKRLAKWMRADDCNLAAVVAVDSPAANWSICKLARRHQPQAIILHLAAPQLWAWGEWRIRKLRRLTDGVLCPLPFAPAWFAARRVIPVFGGHPLTYAVAGARANPPPPGSERSEEPDP